MGPYVFLLCALFAATTRAQMCTKLSDCQSNTCCRKDDGTVLTNSDPWNRWNVQPLSGIVNGTCSSKLAQKGEICDTSTCTCDKGLECYRPMSGACCPPMRCYDQQWVKQQREYWRKCAQNPKCHFPPFLVK